MPRIGFKAGASMDFTPVPKGTYELYIDEVEEGTTKPNDAGETKAKIVAKCHIVNDDTYNDRKVFLHLLTEGKGTFNLRALVEAAIPDKAEIVETDELDDNGKPIASIDFDTDDLIGQTFLADATIRDGDRGPQNNWNKFRSLNENMEAAAGETESEPETEEEQEEEAAPPPAQAAAKPKQNAAPAQGKQNQGKPAAAAQATGKGKQTAAPAANNGQRQRSRLTA
jgi:hypothetical protein